MADNQNNRNQSASSQDAGQLKKVRMEKLAALQAEGKDPFKITTYDQTYHTKEIKDKFEDLCGEQDAEGNYTKEPATVSIAGRMMFKRVMGKASFANLQDRDGRIQIYVSRNDLGDDAYAGFKKLDIGDIIGVKGFPFRTKTGEISVHVKELTLLSKSLEPLPEKFHGLTDTDTRYRQRYVDLIMNEDVRETFKMRSRIIQEIRTFLAGRDFMEVETPMLVENAGGAAADRSSRITMRSMRTESSAFLWNCISSASSSAVWRECMRSGVFSEMKVPTPGITLNSRSWSCIRHIPIITE